MFYKANIIYERFIPSAFNLQNQAEIESNRLQVCNLGVFLPGFLLCVCAFKEIPSALAFHIQLTGDETGFGQKIQRIWNFLAS